MESIDLIRENLKRSEEIVLARIEEMRHHGMVWPTPRGGCHTLWILGHLAFIESQVIQEFMLGRRNDMGTVGSSSGLGDRRSSWPDSLRSRGSGPRTGWGRRSTHIGLRSMTHVSGSVCGDFDAIIAMDNSVPHLLSDAEIAQAFPGFRKVLRPGGALPVSVRDHGPEDRSATRFQRIDAEVDFFQPLLAGRPVAGPMASATRAAPRRDPGP